MQIIGKFVKLYGVFFSITGSLITCQGNEVNVPATSTCSPTIGLLIPNTGFTGDKVKIVGECFGVTEEQVTIHFGPEQAEVTDFSDTLISFHVPDIIGRNLVSVSVNQQTSNTLSFVSKGPPTEKIAIEDEEKYFVNETYNTGGYRSIPIDPDFYYFTGFSNIPRTISVPFAWGTENCYSNNGGYITDNVYVEPDKPWIVQLCISTPGQGDTSTGSPQYKIWYRTSSDNGMTFSLLKQVIVEGFTSMNPIKGVEIGRNGFNVDATRPIVRATNGEVMIPIGLHPWDEVNRKIYLPVPSAYIFQDAGILIGKWLPDGSDLKWEFGEWLRIDHNKSTRGLSEPTIVQINDQGRFAMIARGSNLARLELPCYAWVSFSNDFCRTWSDPVPFTYNNGKNFFVTTAHSTLFTSRTNGKTYWIGNLTETNPRGSFPRYPLVIGEVDLSDFGLIKETVVEIDTRHLFDGEQVQLSNFKILENRVKPEIVVVLTRREGTKVAKQPSWYRIKLK